MTTQSIAPVFASPVDYAKYGHYDSGARLERARAKAGTTVGAIADLYVHRNRLGDERSSWPAEAGRYHLYLGRGCPFCHRLLIALELLGLASTVSFSFVDDERDGRGWAFRATHGPDPINGFTLLSEAYQVSDPHFEGHIGVPVLWDRHSGRIVSNDSGDILFDLATRFTRYADPAVDLYPERLRADIAELDATLHHDVNFGVYLVGLARTQHDYDTAVRRLFARLADLDQRLAHNAYLFGDTLTGSDIRLWVTLARFDVGYYTIFRANLKRLVDLPSLWRYARELYRIEAFRRYTDFDQYRRDYVRNFPQLAPHGIVPAGPVADWSSR